MHEECSTSLAIMEMQIEKALKLYLTPSQNGYHGKDKQHLLVRILQEKEPFSIVGGNVN
jgi:hypothetical protein